MEEISENLSGMIFNVNYLFFTFVADDLLIFCFLYALFKLKSSNLPLLVNVFYSRYMKAEW